MAFSDSRVSLGAPFNNTVTRLSDDQRLQAVQGAQLTEIVQSLYSLVLYDTVADATLVAPTLDPAKRTKNAEYFFRVPPKVHEMDEPFTSNIVPTQDGGKFVESYGSILKSLRISGTTGLRPNKIAPSQIPLLGISDQQLGLLTGNGLNTKPRSISPDEKTGHDDIIFLRNIFRHYSDLKSSDSLAGRVVMLWRNLKDADYWVVEPEDFKLVQNASSPLTYEYSISLKTLSRFDFSYAMPDDPLEAARARTRMLARLQEYGQNILNIFLTISNQINRVQGFATYLSNTVLSPVLNIINGLNAVKTSAYGVVRGLRTQALTLADNLTDAIAQLTAELPPLDPETGNPTDSYSLIRYMRRLQIFCALILSEPVAAESSVSDTSLLVDRYARAYETPGTSTTARRTPDTSPSYIGFETAPAAVGSDIIRPDEDIRDVARRLLGDPSRWRILVTLNRLRSPFISVTGGPGVLMPGDSILFPQDASRAGNFGVVGTGNPSDNERNGYAYAGPDTPVDAAYGRDLLLRSTAVGNEELTDLVLNQAGDIASIVGVPNILQALNIKFMTSRGELRAHPKFGAKYGIGRKATPSSFNELRINVLNTLSSDNRVDNVQDLRFLAVGDTLAVVVDLQVRNARDILQTSFALRRF